MRISLDETLIVRKVVQVASLEDCTQSISMTVWIKLFNDLCEIPFCHRHYKIMKMISHYIWAAQYYRIFVLAENS